MVVENDVEAVLEDVWKDIEGYAGEYQVSNLGRVKSLVKPYGRTEIILKHLLNSVGYTYYQIYMAPEKRKNHLAHRLVMQAFEPNEDKDNLQVNHKDLDIQNNR